MSQLSPIVLFVYNRPEHTIKTLAALKSNALASKSTLYIYADGPKQGANLEQQKAIAKVREAIRAQQWCGTVHIIEREHNWGLADNIIDGVTAATAAYGKAIVLEDDIVTSPGFLQYMNDALDLYENNERVMHISGYMFPVKATLPPTFFYNTASCWGWATWARAWRHYNGDAAMLAPLVEEKGLKKFNINNSYDFYGQLTDNASGKIKTWAVKWYSSMFLNDGFALHPYPSLVNNIGHDGGGENSGQSNVFNWSKLASQIKVSAIPIKESEEAIKAMEKFNAGLHRAYMPNIPMKQKIKAMLPASIKTVGKRFYEKALINRIKVIPRFKQFNTRLINNIPLTGIDSSSFLFIYDEIFKKHIYRFSAKSNAPYIIDCGANVGLATLYFKQQYPHAHIVAFEPDPVIYEVLQNNVGAAKLKNVHMIKAALWKENTVLSFAQEGADGGALGNEAENLIHVNAERLSKYIDREVDFLKIDIEGAETEVIREIAGKLPLVRNLFIEYHSYIAKPQELDLILDILNKAGFRYYLYNVSNLTTNPFLKINTHAGMDMQVNICAVNNKLA